MNTRISTSTNLFDFELVDSPDFKGLCVIRHDKGTIRNMPLDWGWGVNGEFDCVINAVREICVPVLEELDKTQEEIASHIDWAHDKLHQVRIQYQIDYAQETNAQDPPQCQGDD